MTKTEAQNRVVEFILSTQGDSFESDLEKFGVLVARQHIYYAALVMKLDKSSAELLLLELIDTKRPAPKSGLTGF